MRALITAAITLSATLLTTISQGHTGAGFWSVTENHEGTIVAAYDGPDFGLMVECVTPDIFMVSMITSIEFEAPQSGGGAIVRVDKQDFDRAMGIRGESVGQYAATNFLIEDQVVEAMKKAREGILVALTTGEDIRFIGLASVEGSHSALRTAANNCAD